MAQDSTMDPVVHFEMPAENRERMADFYAKTFGWKMQLFGADMGNYVLATTTESGPDGRPKIPGAINGGFFPKEGNPAQCPMLVIAVKDIKTAMQKVAQGGGKVLGEPVEIPNVGQYVSFVDTEGNRVNLLQPLMSNTKYQ